MLKFKLGCYTCACWGRKPPSPGHRGSEPTLKQWKCHPWTCTCRKAYLAGLEPTLEASIDIPWFHQKPSVVLPPAKLSIRLDFHQTHERLDAPRHIGDKLSDKVDFADEFLQFFLHSRRPHCPHIFLTLQADLDSPFMHQEPQNLTGWHTKSAIFWVYLEPKPSSLLQNLTQIF